MIVEIFENLYFTR